MSAAAARRRKQLAAKKAAGGEDAIAKKLEALLAESDDETKAYEALQLAQSQTRKAVKTGKFAEGCGLAHSTALTLLQKNRVSVASQLKMLLLDCLKETHVEATEAWIDKVAELHTAYQTALASQKDAMTETEYNRLERLEREYLRKAVSWSNDLGTIRFGHFKLHKLLGEHSWTLPEGDEEEDKFSIMFDSCQHMCLAEEPLQVVEWLATLDRPNRQQTKFAHKCSPADADSLLTLSLLLLCALENLRDASILLKAYIDKVETRTMDELTTSYMKKDDGKAPAHVVFGAMLLRICEKDPRTGPLFTWLLKSFKKEMDVMPKPNLIQGYTTKIGKVYFDIQPPPSMLSMMENMMGMMGGMGGGGAPGGINPAMMQALAAAQGGM